MSGMIYIVLAVLGLSMGSFVNALVWRLHKQAELKKLNKSDPKYSISTGRSMCPDCGHELSAVDLIPLFSWLTLGGKCRYCRKPISWQYPLAEAVTAMLFVLSYRFWPYGFSQAGDIMMFAVWLVMLTGFMAITIYDLRWMLIPNRIVYPLLGLAGAAIVLQAVAFGGGKDTITGAVMGLISCGGIFYLLFQVSRGKWIGGGDVKLGFLLGLLVGGFWQGLLVIFGASLLGTLYVLPGYATRRIKHSSRIPFGPFLIVAAIAVVLAGGQLIEWYRGILFPGL